MIRYVMHYSDKISLVICRGYDNYMYLDDQFNNVKDWLYDGGVKGEKQNIVICALFILL